MGSRHRLALTVRAGIAVGAAGLVIAGVAVPSATAQDNVLRADQSVARACHAAVLSRKAKGVDQREVTSTVDGLIQARLAPGSGAEGDWDLAVFDKATGGVVAASSALRSRELAESFVKKGQQLVVQACRYDGQGRSVTLGIDFLALTPQGTPTGTPAAVQRAELVRVQTPERADKSTLLGLGLDVTEEGDATGVEVVLADDTDRKTLRDSGLRFTTVNSDLSRTSREDAAEDRVYAGKVKASALPSGRTAYRHLYEYEYAFKDACPIRTSAGCDNRIQ